MPPPSKIPMQSRQGMSAPVTMDDIDERLRAVIEGVLDDRRRIDMETHAAHHAWVAAQIEKDQARAAMMSKLAERGIWWAIVAVLGWAAHKLLGFKVGPDGVG